MPLPKTFRIAYDPKLKFWTLNEDRTTTPLGVYPTQDAALIAGQQSARAGRPCDLLMHAKDGRIELEWHYGNQPYQPRGKDIVSSIVH